MIGVEDAQALCLDLVTPTAAFEDVALEHAFGRVLRREDKLHRVAWPSQPRHSTEPHASEWEPRVRTARQQGVRRLQHRRCWNSWRTQSSARRCSFLSGANRDHVLRKPGRQPRSWPVTRTDRSRRRADAPAVPEPDRKCHQGPQDRRRPGRHHHGGIHQRRKTFRSRHRQSTSRSPTTASGLIRSSRTRSS